MFENHNALCVDARKPRKTAVREGAIATTERPMYKSNRNYKVPRNRSNQIWRYMSLASFISVLQKSQLFFTTLDRLDDPFEGRILLPKELLIGNKIIPVEGLLLKSLANQQTEGRRRICVNCWHINDGESAAMWALYSKESGIAIQSTIVRLQRSFGSEPRDVCVGEVNYHDYTGRELIAMRQFESLHMTKRRSFEHEREIRAVVEVSSYVHKYGIYISVDLPMLIERIYVSPVAPKWIASVVEGVMKRYGIANMELIHSGLYRIDE
jgi:hypothetical protein